MKKRSTYMGLYPFILLASLLLVHCGSSSDSSDSSSNIDAGSSNVDYDPTWISASWSGGARGAPNDRMDVEADRWIGTMCPASSVLLTNWDQNVGNVLNIINSCTETVTYAVCVAKGSLAQPDIGGLSECATDPFETPYSSLSFYTITNGSEGDFINTTQALSVNIFYCSSSQTLNAFTSRLSCL